MKREDLECDRWLGQAEPPATFGEYELVEMLGRGGTASVMRARGPHRPDRPAVVALKFLHDSLADDVEAQAAFRGEGTLGIPLVHPHLVRTYGFEIANGQTALVLECVDGASFYAIHRQLLRTPPAPLDQYVVARLIAQVCRGLAALHAATDSDGLLRRAVHRDISLGNLIVDEHGSARVIDLGAAHTAGRPVRTRTGMVKGKLAYMAPEYLEGKSWDQRIDLWSVGVVLWEMLTGRRLFRGETPSQTVCAVIAAQIPNPRTLRHGISSDLARVALHALERTPDRRYRSAAAMAGELEACLALECPTLDATDVISFVNRLPLGATSGVARIVRPMLAREAPTASAEAERARRRG